MWRTEKVRVALGAVLVDLAGADTGVTYVRDRRLRITRLALTSAIRLVTAVKTATALVKLAKLTGLFPMRAQERILWHLLAENAIELLRIGFRPCCPYYAHTSKNRF